RHSRKSGKSRTQHGKNLSEATTIFSRHSRAGGNLSSFPRRRESRTRDGGNIQRLSENSEVDSRLRGNDGGAVSVFSGKYPQAKIPLFSQKQKTKNRNRSVIIPAQAGI
ncbi:hypothetical protein, partial [Neisseria meningitidis]|uniref:hypothetical protein n=1 Tax=Neisseria meningitidis TaxID=487 RepID=UPI00164070C8